MSRTISDSVRRLVASESAGGCIALPFLESRYTADSPRAGLEVASDTRYGILEGGGLRLIFVAGTDESDNRQHIAFVPIDFAGAHGRSVRRASSSISRAASSCACIRARHSRASWRAVRSA